MLCICSDTILFHLFLSWISHLEDTRWFTAVLLKYSYKPEKCFLCSAVFYPFSCATKQVASSNFMIYWSLCSCGDSQWCLPLCGFVIDFNCIRSKCCCRIHLCVRKRMFVLLHRSIDKSLEVHLMGKLWDEVKGCRNQMVCERHFFYILLRYVYLLLIWLTKVGEVTIWILRWHNPNRLCCSLCTVHIKNSLDCISV